jgi:hypothetical protein
MVPRDSEKNLNIYRVNSYYNHSFNLSRRRLAAEAQLQSALLLTAVGRASVRHADSGTFPRSNGEDAGIARYVSLC